MLHTRRAYHTWLTALALMAGLLWHVPAQAQEEEKTDTTEVDDIFRMPEGWLPIDTAVMVTDSSLAIADSLPTVPKMQNIYGRGTEHFMPDPVRATWLALVFPGGGQIYNRKYWKLPIFYGGFLGCMYALTWNNMMYRDYSQAYLDIMDDDPDTKSYENMLPPGYSIEGREERYQEIFQSRKNRYRRYRDLSVFAFIGVYALSIIDAYVDAELSSFDISPSLSMHVEPAAISTYAMGNTGGRLQQQSYGLQCSLSF